MVRESGVLDVDYIFIAASRSASGREFVARAKITTDPSIRACVEKHIVMLMITMCCESNRLVGTNMQEMLK